MTEEGLDIDHYAILFCVGLLTMIHKEGSKGCWFIVSKKDTNDIFYVFPAFWLLFMSWLSLGLRL